MDWRAGAALYIALLSVVILLQWRGNAFRVEAAVHGDEPAHLVTGLMVRDWLAGGLSKPPMEHAEQFYLHYPKVALGHWPPVFYAVQGVWLMVAPPTRAGVLLLMAALAAGLALRIATVLHRAGAPRWLWASSAFLFVLLTPVIEYSRMVMAELLLCWLCLEAMLAFHRWLFQPGARHAAGFAVWSTLAILTKVTALALAMLPVFAILFTRRWALLRERSLWLAGGAVGLFTAPWYLLVPGARHEAVGAYVGVPLLFNGYSPTAALFPRIIRFVQDLPALLFWLGPLLLLAAWSLWRDRDSSRVPAMAAAGWLAAVMAFRFIVISASYEERTMLPLVPPLVICAASAAGWFASRLHSQRVKVAGALLLAGFVVFGVVRMPPKEPSGVEQLAHYLCTQPEFRQSVIMVASDSFREGALIAEMALGEQRPGHFVLRATKIMAESNWTGWHYKLKVASPEETMALLDRIPVGIVLFDPKPRKTSPHLKVMADTLKRFPDRLVRVPLPGADGVLAAYRVVGNEAKPLAQVSIGLFGLGRSIGKQ